MARSPTPPVTLEQPRSGGSYLRQDDGSLKLVEGAIDPDVVVEAPPAPPPADAGDTSVAQKGA